MDTLTTLKNRSRITGNRKDDALLQLLTEVSYAIEQAAGAGSDLTKLHLSVGSEHIMTHEGEVLVCDGDVLRNSIVTQG